MTLPQHQHVTLISVLLSFLSLHSYQCYYHSCLCQLYLWERIEQHDKVYVIFGGIFPSHVHS